MTVLSNRFSAFWLSSGIAFVGLLPQSAEASCGLERCPIDRTDDVLDSKARVGVDARLTGPESGNGFYQESFLHLGWSAIEPLSLGAYLPVVYRLDASESLLGLGNAVLYGDWTLPLASKSVRVAAGLQVEMPSSTRPELGDSHFFWLPYVRSEWRGDRWFASARAGWGTTLESGEGHHHASDHSHSHSHSHSSSFEVNPHSASELLVSTDLSWRVPLGDLSLQPGIGINGIQELVDRPQQLLSGVAFGAISWKDLQIKVHVELPLSASKRFRWRSGLSVLMRPGHADQVASSTGRSAWLER